MTDNKSDTTAHIGPANVKELIKVLLKMKHTGATLRQLMAVAEGSASLAMQYKEVLFQYQEL